MLILALLIACGEPVDAEQGPEGAQGIDGAAGSPGATGAQGDAGADGVAGPPGPVAFRWVDALGVEALPSPELIHMADGYAWRVDVELAEVIPQVASTVYYTTGVCTGNGYLWAEVRMPTAVLGIPDLYTRRDTQQSFEVCALSAFGVTEGCHDVDVCLMLVAFDEMEVNPNLMIPAMGWSAPLHRE